MKAKKLPSGSWRCRAVDHYEQVLQPDGSIKKKTVYRSFTCSDPSVKGRKECERMAAEWAATHDTKIQSCTMSFGDALDKYIKSREAVLSVRTIGEYKRIRKCHLKSIMDIPVDRITQEQIQICINEEALEHSPKTVRNWHGLISAVLRVYRPSMVLKTTLPKKVRSEMKIPTEAEIKVLLEYIKGTPLELPVMLAIFGPMRRGEICAVTREDCDGDILHVHSSLVINEDREWIVKSPKSLAGDRRIQFPPQVVALWEQVPSGRLVTRYNPGTLWKAYTAALEKCGLPHYRFHDLRHFGASMLHSIGIPDVYIMSRGGWDDDTTLKNIYRHKIAEKETENNKKINECFSGLISS